MQSEGERKEWTQYELNNTVVTDNRIFTTKNKQITKQEMLKRRINENEYAFAVLNDIIIGISKLHNVQF